MDPVLVKYILLSIIGLIYNGSLIGAVFYSIEYQIDINWCSGTGFLIILTCILYFGLIYNFVFKRLNFKWKKNIFTNWPILINIIRSKWTKWSILGLLYTSIIVFVALGMYVYTKHNKIFKFLIVDC